MVIKIKNEDPSYYKFFTKIAPDFLQHVYDNARLITGNGNWECSGILVSPDTTENIVNEAIEKKCNLVMPITRLFSGA